VSVTGLPGSPGLSDGKFAAEAPSPTQRSKQVVTNRDHIQNMNENTSLIPTERIERAMLIIRGVCEA